MEPLGLEHLLYGFRIPYVVYSDMNGFGHFRQLTCSLIVLLGCVLRAAAGRRPLLFSRGTRTELRGSGCVTRARDDTGRAMTAVSCVPLWAARGGWIYWNTNVLNAYKTARVPAARAAAYERALRRLGRTAAPAFSDITMEVDVVSGGAPAGIARPRHAEQHGRMSRSPSSRCRPIRASGRHADRWSAPRSRAGPIRPWGFRVFRLGHALRPGRLDRDGLDSDQGEPRVRQLRSGQRDRRERHLRRPAEHRAVARPTTRNAN